MQPCFGFAIGPFSPNSTSHHNGFSGIGHGGALLHRGAGCTLPSDKVLASLHSQWQSNCRASPVFETESSQMGDYGLHINRPVCSRFGCGRRAYEVAGSEGFLCYVCDSADHRDWALRRWRGVVGRPRSSMLQCHLDDNLCGGITLLFLFGDGWSQQCICRHCQHSWLNRGWVCPPDWFRKKSLVILDGLYTMMGYTSRELVYVDWDAAVIAVHDQFPDYQPERLLDFATASAARVLLECILVARQCSAHP